MSRPSVEVVTGRQQVHRAGAAARAAARTIVPARAHDLGATRDLFFLAPGRDIIFEVATWVATRKVATWEVKSRHGFGVHYIRTKWPQVATWKNGVPT